MDEVTGSIPVRSTNDEKIWLTPDFFAFVEAAAKSPSGDRRGGVAKILSDDEGLFVIRQEVREALNFPFICLIFP